MQLTVIFGEKVIALEVGPEMELENFYALVSSEIPSLESIPTYQLAFLHNQRRILLTGENLAMTIQAHSFNDQDIVYIIPASRTFPHQTASSSRTQDTAAARANIAGTPLLNELIGQLVSGIKVPPKKRQLTKEEKVADYRALSRKIYDRLKADPQSIRALKLERPQIANAFEEKPDDYEYFHQKFVETEETFKRGAAAIHDGTSVDGQKFIEEQMRIQAINAQYEYAMEHTPEAFIPINLLHILIKINDVEFLAMIDSGAQGSVISIDIAKKCNILGFVDERYFTKASGIGGSSKVKGRIHAAKLQIGDIHLSTPIDVIDEPRVELLLGLTFLRPNHAVIDLKRNVLIIGDVEVPFLGEAEFKRELKRLKQKGIGKGFSDDEDTPMETEK